MRIWGKTWKYIIEGRDIYPVKEFDIRRVQVTNENYGQGAIRFAYICDEDERAIREGGYLKRLIPGADAPEA
jgi:5-methylcytosine-specific restriction protein A